jgi:2-alkyl-3-oxoalkanoate reductase
MRVLIAGAGGTIGRPLLGRLVAAGAEVTGLTRTRASAAAIAAFGARPVVADALDPTQLAGAVREARPEVVVHLLTALPKHGPVRGRDLKATNRLREEGTANLIAACKAAGVERLVAESIVFAYGFGEIGEPVSDEPAREVVSSWALARAQEAVLSLERQVLDAAAAGAFVGVVARLGTLYGAAVPSSEFMLTMLRRRLMGLPGGGHGVLPWIEISDAVAAIARALETGGGSYNIVDDEPVTVRAFVEELARVFATPKPYPLPYWLGRLTMPLGAHLLDCTVLRPSNAKAKEELAWSPTYPGYRDGIRHWAGPAAGRPQAN